MLSVVLDIPLCTEPIGSVCDLTPSQPQHKSHGTDVIIELEVDCDEDDEEEFEMHNEEQSKLESSDLASVADEDEIFDSDSGDGHGLFNKLYEGRFWEPEPDGTIKILQWDMFIDKSSFLDLIRDCLLYTSPSPRDGLLSRMPSSA